MLIVDTLVESPNADLDPSDSRAFSAKRVAVIRTSDRTQFKSCRRAWGWSSHLRMGLGRPEAISPLWLGTGFHYAMEDYYGVQAYGSATRAFKAYVAACEAKGSHTLPGSWIEDTELAINMLDYYVNEWEPPREKLTTFVYDGKPQVEVNGRILIPFDDATLNEWGYDEAVYSVTIDRVVIDDVGQLWGLDYKTAKQFEITHLETDPQVSAYSWALSVLYPNHPIGGFYYQQHKKELPDPPRMVSGGKLSTFKNQNTSYRKYLEVVNNIYGSTERAPSEVIETLNHLAKDEQLHANSYVRRDKTERNAHQIQAEGQKILMEVADILNPMLDLYPNPTRGCGYCTFNSPCISMDSGGDWELELNALYQKREPVYDSWRTYLPDPKEFSDG